MCTTVTSDLLRKAFRPRCPAGARDAVCALLREAGVGLLRQAEALLTALDSEAYSAVPARIAPHRVGGHLRHILEFYECFLDGAPSGRIDYDARKRDYTVETDRGAALAKTRAIIERLQTGSWSDEDPIPVRMEAGDHFLVSSAARELQVLNSHTIHHFALIAVVLRTLDIPVARDFGMAPSTLQFQAEARKCAR